MPHHTGTQGEAPGLVSSEEKAWLRAFVFSTGKARQGRGNGLELASLNNSLDPGGIGAVPCCLVPGPGLI